MARGAAGELAAGYSEEAPVLLAMRAGPWSEHRKLTGRGDILRFSSRLAAVGSNPDRRVLAREWYGQRGGSHQTAGGVALVISRCPGCGIKSMVENVFVDGSGKIAAHTISVECEEAPAKGSHCSGFVRTRPVFEEDLGEERESSVAARLSRQVPPTPSEWVKRSVQTHMRALFDRNATLMEQALVDDEALHLGDLGEGSILTSTTRQGWEHLWGSLSRDARNVSLTLEHAFYDGALLVMMQWKSQMDGLEHATDTFLYGGDLGKVVWHAVSARHAWSQRERRAWFGPSTLGSLGRRLAGAVFGAA